MSTLLLAGWLLVTNALPDTSVALWPGDMIVLTDVSGAVTVETWDRAELQVVDEGGDARQLSVSRDGARVVVRPGDRKGRGLEIEVRIRVPAWAALDIRGTDLDVTVSGTAAGLRVRNLSGDIHVRNTSGALELNSVEGEIVVRNARGGVTAVSRGDDVTVVGGQGPVDIRSGDGNLVMDGVESSSVRAETLDGNLTFTGNLARGGSYAFSVHDGDADITVPATASALVRVATFDGEFTSDFKVTLQQYGGGGKFEFILGDGSAQVDIAVFDGDIRLLRRQ